jgi:hypothetical protein
MTARTKNSSRPAAESENTSTLPAALLALTDWIGMDYESVNGM